MSCVPKYAKDCSAPTPNLLRWPARCCAAVDPGSRACCGLSPRVSRPRAAVKYASSCRVVIPQALSQMARYTGSES